MLSTTSTTTTKAVSRRQWSFFGRGIDSGSRQTHFAAARPVFSSSLPYALSPPATNLSGVHALRQLQRPRFMCAAAAAARGSGLQSPLMGQYFEHKKKYPDYVLFMRVGDFYEFFLDDAVIASRALDIVLTKRSNVPMAGVPVHLLHQYLGKLVRQGYKAAICDQVESAAEARKRTKGKGGGSIIRREVVRLITPGTITDDFANMEVGQTNFLACVLERPSPACSSGGDNRGGFIGMSWLDICSGDFMVATAHLSLIHI